MRGITLIAIIGLILIVLLMLNVISITNNQIVLSFPDINYFVSFLGAMVYFSKSEGKKWGE